MNKQNKFALAILMLFVSFSGFSSVEIDKTQSHDNMLSGHIQDTQVYFSGIDGYSLNPTRKMQRITVELNDKIITIQTSQESKEFYVKGQDRTGGITTLSILDYALIQEAMVNLAKPAANNEYDGLSQVLAKSFALIAMWSDTMPLLIWQNDGVAISAVDEQTVVDSKKTVLDSPIKTVNPSILNNPDARLQFPEIVPPTPELLKETQLQASKKQFRPLPKPQPSKDLGAPSSYDSSVDLCGEIGKPKSGLYPLFKYKPGVWVNVALDLTRPTYLTPLTIVSDLYPNDANVMVTGIDRYPESGNPVPVIGGKGCNARCGGGCTDVIKVNESIKLSPFGSNVYSEDCLDHDMCASPLSEGGLGHNVIDMACNFIFPAAANDLMFMRDCEHDVQIVNAFVSKNKNATTQDLNFFASDDLYLIYDFKNMGIGRLPHDNLFVQISIDGVIQGEQQLTSVDGLGQLERKTFNFPMGKLKPGKHDYKIEILAGLGYPDSLIEVIPGALVQTLGDNNKVEGTFQVGGLTDLTVTVVGDGSVSYSSTPLVGNSICTSATSPCEVFFNIAQGTINTITLTAKNSDGTEAIGSTWSGKGAEGCTAATAKCVVTFDPANTNPPAITATIKSSGCGRPPVRVGNLLVQSCDADVADVDGAYLWYGKYYYWDGAIIVAQSYGAGWRLPTKDELNLVYQNKDVVGSFGNYGYWSSTEYSGSNVWIQDFTNGYQTSYYEKTHYFAMRAVRTF